MGKRIVPASQQPMEGRIQQYVPYNLWYCPCFPIAELGGKLDKDPTEMEWLQGLYDDLKESNRFRNPVFVWNHHPNRLTGKQPQWLLRAGSNRIWCAEQLGWETVPALVSTVPTDKPPCEAIMVAPRYMEQYLNDPGVIWANDYGFGLLAVDRPEETYKEAKNRHLEATTNYGRDRITHIKELV